jgi:adenylate cyclase
MMLRNPDPGQAMAAEGVPADARGHAAVAFADIVGYTIMAASDGERTHARWMQLLWRTVAPLARQHGARVVKSTGDGVVAAFPGTAAAFAWASALHQATRPDAAGSSAPLVFRIAIHAGPVHFTEEGVYGDTVNIAARLEGHAPPGGIVISEAARAELPDPPALVDLGLLRLRNLPVPVHAFALFPENAPRLPEPAKLHDTPAIAVMPLDLPGGDEADRYLANGIIEDIVVSLGALRELAVIARGATLGWAGAAQDPRVIGRMLGARYVLRGTLRRGSDRLRLTADLRETEEGDSIWADRMEVGLGELFDVQDAIVERTVAGIAPGIRAAELRRALRKKPESLTAYDLTLRGMHALEVLQRDTFGTARHHLDQAITEDPSFAVPVAWAAQWHSLAVGQSWSPAPEDDARQAGHMAQRSIQLDPRCALGHAVAGHHRAYHQRDPLAALPAYDRALAACPSHALAWTLKSASLSYLGRGNEALVAAERGFALWPHGPERFYYEFFVGLAHYACGNLADAARWARLSLDDNQGFTSAHKLLMAALSALGRREEAAEIATRMLALEPGVSLARYEAERVPVVDPALRQRLIGDMRAAGLPD